MYMDVEPTSHELNLAQERDIIMEAAAKIAAVLAQAPLEERSELVQTVDESLIDAGVAVIDTTGSDETERRGKYHNVSRTELIAIVAAREERWRRKQSGRPTQLRGYM